ncbi:hypothetical protein CEUSTIGMA_g10530.t1 [Chlamydomonas eustigma]|uniref:F-box domain-containing protein n=1 Tax=Chlamydomonas eustigma TaxID=1157962 RepID=A0A250XJ48_9CHLO|nr:hypothetical protein CEUSTIGMA_g10530.t1 [Chlamydomonas eustigma]|eukprot:GAX83104.1 hypothetical protein CEUSTIGMA_g10530.t1 [Chlamydomonas eustigma]
MTVAVLPGSLHRPWLSLYGHFLKPKTVDNESEGDFEQFELAPIQELLPDEMLHLILARLSPYSLGSVACVCKHWREVVEHPPLWEAACTEAFQLQYRDYTARAEVAYRKFRGSWRRMFLELPHIRFDGVFVSRNSYIRTGVPDMSRHKVVNLVLNYRYYRFLPDGTLLYRTSPLTISKVAKSLRGHRDSSSQTSSVGDHVFSGRYILKGTMVYIIVVYPNSRSTQIRSKLKLRSTTPGANNRLDIESIVSYDCEDGRESSLLPQQVLDPDSEVDPNALNLSQREHRRGMNCCVFVPWDQVKTSVLNLPPGQMDIFIPG